MQKQIVLFHDKINLKCKCCAPLHEVEENVVIIVIGPWVMELIQNIQ
jgi:hypothetical protein